jgi:hypothetical protein
MLITTQQTNSLWTLGRSMQCLHLSDSFSIFVRGEILSGAFALGVRTEEALGGGMYQSLGNERPYKCFHGAWHLMRGFSSL